MSVLSQHAHFRRHFAIKGSTAGVALTFVQGSPDTITRGAGSFIVDGHLADHALDVADTASNNGRWSTAAVAALTLTLASNNDLTNEGPLVASLIGSFIDPGGYDRWPADHVRLAASGFGDSGSTITGIPTPYAASIFGVTCNASAADAVPGVDEYRWYLSQRTDVPARQYLSIVSKLGDPPDPNTYSGSVRIMHTTLAETAFGFTGSMDFTPDLVPLLFRHCHLYVQRLSDNAIQWVDLLRAMTAGY